MTISKELTTIKLFINCELMQKLNYLNNGMINVTIPKINLKWI